VTGGEEVVLAAPLDVEADAALVVAAVRRHAAADVLLQLAGRLNLSIFFNERTMFFSHNNQHQHKHKPNFSETNQH
jgi:hypothetical protein